MVKRGEKSACCIPADKKASSCKIESIISVDERGQMVLPKELRDKANIKTGDKLAIISWEKDGKVCCLSLIKAENLAEMTKDLLGPMMKEALTK